MIKEVEYCDNCNDIVNRKHGSINIDAKQIIVFNGVAGCGKGGDYRMDNGGHFEARVFSFCNFKCLKDYLTHRCVPITDRTEKHGAPIRIRRSEKRR